FVHQGLASDVEAVMVDGRWIMRDGRVLTLDEPALVAEADRIAPAAWRRPFQGRPDLPPPAGFALGAGETETLALPPRTSTRSPRGSRRSCGGSTAPGPTCS